MGFFDEFVGGVSDSISVRQNKSKGAATGESYGSVAGQTFFNFASDYLKGTRARDRLKVAVEEKIANSRTAQAYISEVEMNKIRGYLRNPVVWAWVIGIGLIVGYVGFSFGKR